MFLKELNKEEATTFISLIKNLAVIDNMFSKKEKELIEDYKSDLNLSDDDIKELSFEESISKLDSSSVRAKNIIYFELTGLALVDGVFDKEEEVFLDNIAKAFEISLDKQLSYLDFFKQVKDFYDIALDNYDSFLEKLNQKALALLPQ
ncbi:MAG: hypothetical protein AB6733_02210 [Clostridiaceae bacterium]